MVTFLQPSPTAALYNANPYSMVDGLVVLAGLSVRSIPDIVTKSEPCSRQIPSCVADAGVATPPVYAVIRGLAPIVEGSFWKTMGLANVPVAVKAIGAAMVSV